MLPLSLASMSDFRRTFYQWAFPVADPVNLNEERRQQTLAIKCAGRLLPLLPKVLSRKTALTPQQETDYLLTLLLALRMGALYEQLDHVADRIVAILPQLPASRHKTHLMTHLYIACDHTDLLSEALAAVSSWPSETLSDEDRYICQCLQEELETAIA